MIAAHPAIAVVEFGGNDGLRGLPITATRTNLDQIIATLQHAGIKVALAGITLPPNYGQDYIQAINETYVLAAKKFRVPLLPFLSPTSTTSPEPSSPTASTPPPKATPS